MGEMIKMVVVLTILSVISGASLAMVTETTAPQIELNRLQFVKGPAIKEILKGTSNDPIVDRFKINVGEAERNFFVGVFDGKANSVAFEGSGKGFGGEVGIVVGVDLDTDKIIGVGVTTHSETPGVGSRAKTDPSFAAQFRGKPFTPDFKVKSDGGDVDAIGGATITSRAVASGVAEAARMYKELKPQIVEQAKSFK